MKKCDTVCWMKRISLAFVILLIVVLIGIFILPKTNKVVAPSNTKPMPTEEVFCSPQDIEGNLTLQGAAGNIYGDITLKNISNQKCTIEGDKFIAASFSATNVKILPQGQKGSSTIALRPGQIVYSQIHYPNGPQCSGSTVQTPINFSYEVSPTSIVTFAPTGHLPSTTVPTCTSTNEITQIDVWGISLNPLH